MLFGHLALVAAALFTGAALYVNVVEQPARLALDDAAALAHWKLAHGRAFALQAAMILAGVALAVVAFAQTVQWRWLGGSVLLLASWPFTRVGILPTDSRLLALAPATAGPDSRHLITNWGQLHTVRTGFGALATLIFFWAALG